MSKIALTGLSMLVIFCTAFVATASDFDGKKPLLCAVIDAMECSPGGDCRKVTPKSIDIPRFVHVDFKKKIIKAKGAEWEKRKTKIEHLARLDGKLTLHGAEDGREEIRDGLGWSMAINDSTGDMVLTASGDEVGFVIFGACTSLSKL